MRPFFSRASIDTFVPEQLRAAGADRVRQARLLVAIAFVASIVALIGTVLHLISGSHWIAFAFVSSAVMWAGAPFVLKKRGSIFLAGNLVTLAWFLTASASALSRGGTGAPSLAPSFISPLLATLLVGKRSGLGWAAASIVWIALLVAAKQYGVEFPERVPIESQLAVNAFMGIIFMSITLGIGLIYESMKNAALAELEQRAEEARREHEERVRAEAEAKLMFADRMASIGRLAAGVAHEVNNPLAYVIINLELVREAIDARPPRVTKDLLDALDEALAGSIRIRSIVRDLKTFARAESEELTPVDVHETLDSMIRMITNEARHRARLVKNYGDIPHVRASESRLAQVFLNVLLNAIQAIPVGRANEDEIRISTSCDQSKVTIEIADTGVGIPEELIGRVMDPFFTTKSPGSGTGLGLSVSRSIIDRFGGSMDISSTVGRGTIVKIVLEASAPPRSVSGPRVTVPPPPAQRRARVLIIDDELPVAKALARILKEHEISIISSGSEALTVLADDQNFDVIFCDLMMPDLTGMEAFERVNEISNTLGARMVFISGGVFTGAAREFVDRVADRYLDKPFDAKKVHEVFTRIVEQSQKNRGGDYETCGTSSSG